MSDLTRDWLKAFGRPQPSVASGLVFQPSATRALWADISLYFLDDGAYQRWRKRTKQRLQPNQILAMKVPRGLGGDMDDLDNFGVEDIRSFYENDGADSHESPGQDGCQQKEEVKRADRRTDTVKVW